MSLRTPALFTGCFSLMVASCVSVLQAGDAADYRSPATWTEDERKGGYVVFQHSTLTSLPTSHVPAREAIVQRVTCELARGEYESLQLGVFALGTEPLKDVRLSIETDLDVEVFRRISSDVKQRLASASPWVRVATWMSAEHYLERGEVTEELAPGKSTNFWITFRASEETPAGPHAGKIRIQANGKPETVIALQIRVHSFQLSPARAAFGMYYREDVLPARLTTDKATLAMYRDMAAHGQNSATFYMGGDFTQLPPSRCRVVDKSLALAHSVGLTHADVPVLMLQDNITALDVDGMKHAAAWLQSKCAARGWPEIIRYGWDEPAYPLPRLRKVCLPMREVDLRLGTAMSVIAAYGHGDLHDVWIVLGGDITPEMQAEAERANAEVWTYSFRILREGYLPLRQRYFAGLYTWALRLGGNYVWAYCDSHHSHAWWAPKSDEPMPVLGWEARRDGVDDYRYLQMVEDRVREHAGKNEIADEAAVWLNTLRIRLSDVDPHQVVTGKPLSIAEYDDIRARAASYIERIGPTPSVDPKRPVIRYVKDEAASYRDRSIEECIAGLQHDDAAVRRAAVWSLFERGPAATPAIDRLGELLDDPEVRIPVLRTLELLAPATQRIAQRIEPLSRHTDGYVRLGAVFALGAMGSPPRQVSWLSEQNRPLLSVDPAPEARVAVPGLRAALIDGFGPVALTAGQQLARFGSYASVALPDAIELLDHPDDKYRLAGMKIIATLGSAGHVAVPKLVARYRTSKGIASSEPLTLAAIGPAATAAVAALETYGTTSNAFLPDTLYALFCVRGHTSDLEDMVDLLDRTDLSRPWAKRDVIDFLNALGIKAEAVVTQARGLLDSENLDDTAKKGLRAFLKKVEAKEGPYVILP